MQVTVEDAGVHTKRLKVTLPVESVSKEIEKAYKKLGREVAIKGFRKGKVPRKVLEKNYGPKVEYDVGEKLIQETYFDALGETKIDAVTHPELRSQKFGDDGSFVYEAEVAVRPQFELGEYKGLKVEHPSPEATDEEVDAAIDNMRREMAPLRSVDDRGIVHEDVAVIDFQGYHNGEAMPQVRAENYTVDIGSGRFGEDFEKNLLGLKKGEKTDRTIDFPENFPNPVLAGKNIEFKIEIKDVKERVLPDLDDEFAKDAGKEYATLADLKKAVRDKISAGKEEAGAGDLADKMMLQLLENHEFDVPARLVAYEVNSLIKEMEDNLTNQGMTLESAGINRDDLVEQYKDTAAKRVKGDFILKKIAEVEKIKLEDGDIEKGFQRIAQRYNMPVEDVKKYFANRDDLLPFMNELLSEKIISFLKENADIKIVASEKKSAKKPAAKKTAAKKETAKEPAEKKTEAKAKPARKSAKGDE
ncbi:MAG: trigger factor [Proteobacteria bacterium]|nr:trigger factor [Pseudomonadota bacterium]MBU1738640.1 trigger factor [Pseudomonadota bacterium]